MIGRSYAQCPEVPLICTEISMGKYAKYNNFKTRDAGVPKGYSEGLLLVFLTTYSQSK